MWLMGMPLLSFEIRSKTFLLQNVFICHFADRSLRAGALPSCPVLALSHFADRSLRAVIMLARLFSINA